MTSSSPSLRSRFGAPAIVVGAGPNGLAAAIRLAQAGLRVIVYEANSAPGGALRSMPLTRAGFVHDVGAAVLPLGIASPFLGRLPLAQHGLRWIHPDFPLAHPLDGGRVVLLHHSLAHTAKELGRDGKAYGRLMRPIVNKWDALADEILGPLVRIPRKPLTLARFGMRALLPASSTAKIAFRDPPARALWSGLAAHSAMPLDSWGTSAVALVLAALAHRVGWPFPEGGAQSLTDALVAHLRSLGGEVKTGTRVTSLDELDRAGIVLLDVPPEEFLRLAGNQLPQSYRHSLSRFERGPGAFKLDWALDGPIPWTNPHVKRAGTVHLGGTLEEIAASEAAVAQGMVVDRPFVILAQPSRFDSTRAPKGMHTVWAYCHVPNGSAIDMSEGIEAQIERFAPGFRQRVVARHVSTPQDLETLDSNLRGGDINGGAQSLWQTIARPVLRSDPYRTPLDGVYLCSASTPPGGGVHGMCGFHSAESALTHSKLDSALTLPPGADEPA